MIIDSTTKISQLLKENSAALDAISALAKPLEKLRNPILRKLMASRTTIGEAAKIGGCKVEEFFLVLRPLGFDIAEAPLAAAQVPDGDTPVPDKPDWLTRLTPRQITQFDVRQMLSSGHDPLKEIMAEYKKVQPGTALQIINTFVPTLLLRLLENKGAKTFSETIEPRLTHSYFFKPAIPEAAAEETTPAAPAIRQPAAVKPSDQIATVDEATFKQELSRYTPSQLKEIDVRALEMPEPMQTILRELESLAPSNGLYVHHKRIPVYLLEDLQASGKYTVWIWPFAETGVELLLTHNSGT